MAAVETIGRIVTSTPFRELPSPQNIPETPDWTPGLDGASHFTPLATDVVRTYNEAMESIANLTSHEIKRDSFE